MKTGQCAGGLVAALVAGLACACAQSAVPAESSTPVQPLRQPRPVRSCIQETMQGQSAHRRLLLDDRGQLVREVRTDGPSSWEAVYYRDEAGRLIERVGSGARNTNVQFAYGEHGELRSRRDIASGVQRDVLLAWRGRFFAAEPRVRTFTAGGAATAPMADDILPEDLAAWQWANPMAPLGFTGEVLVLLAGGRPPGRFEYDAESRLRRTRGSSINQDYEWDALGRLTRSSWTENALGRTQGWEALHRYDAGGSDVSIRMQGMGIESYGVRYNQEGWPIEGRQSGIVVERSTWAPCEPMPAPAGR